MSAENLMTDPAATTTEGDPASQPTEQMPATGADTGGQQQPDGQQQSAEQHTEEPGKDDGQTAKDPETSDGAPEAYEFTPPEGQEYDPQVIEQFEEVARELNLSQEEAQTVLDKMAPVIAERQAEQIKAVHEQWVAEAKADSEFGGDKLNENLALAKNAMEEFASPELRTLLNESGMGNNPEVIRLFVRVGKAISEDRFVQGGAGPAGSQSRDPKRLYPNSNMT